MQVLRSLDFDAIRASEESFDVFKGCCEPVGLIEDISNVASGRLDIGAVKGAQDSDLDEQLNSGDDVCGKPKSVRHGDHLNRGGWKGGIGVGVSGRLFLHHRSHSALGEKASLYASYRDQWASAMRVGLVAMRGCGLVMSSCLHFSNNYSKNRSQIQRVGKTMQGAVS